MDVRDYDNFDLAIESAGGDGDHAFEVRVLDSPAGEAAATFDLPFTPEGLENFTLRMASRRSVVRRMGLAPRNWPRCRGSSSTAAPWVGS